MDVYTNIIDVFTMPLYYQFSPKTIKLYDAMVQVLRLVYVSYFYEARP